MMPIFKIYCSTNVPIQITVYGLLGPFVLHIVWSNKQFHKRFHVPRSVCCVEMLLLQL